MFICCLLWFTSHLDRKIPWPMFNVFCRIFMISFYITFIHITFKTVIRRQNSCQKLLFTQHRPVVVCFVCTKMLNLWMTLNGNMIYRKGGGYLNWHRSSDVENQIEARRKKKQRIKFAEYSASHQRLYREPSNFTSLINSLCVFFSLWLNPFVFCMHVCVRLIPYSFHISPKTRLF